MVSPPQPPRELGYATLAELSDDETFRLRQPGEVSSLAQSIAQVGQLFPIEVREVEGRLQPLTGFRRLRALRLLHRNRVLIRSHGEIPDEVAAMIAAADAIDSRSLEVEELRELHERYASMGWSTPALQELIARAIERATERLEDLEARLRGEAAPDRSIVDEDELDDEEGGPVLRLDDLAGAAPPLSVGSTGGSAPASAVDSTGGSAPASAVDSAGGSSGASAVDSAGGSAGASAVDSTGGSAPASADDSAGGSAGASAVDAAAGDRGGEGEDAWAGAASGPDRAREASADDLAGARLARPPAEEPLAPLLGGVWPLGQGAPPPAQRVEMTVNGLARDMAERLSEITQDFSTLVDHWGEVPEDLRGILGDQLIYYSRLGSWLIRSSGEDK